jgi:phosphoribosylamine--glycine ligase
MNIMVIGGGGREHAVIKSLKKNPEVKTVYALPGNGGIAADAVCVPIGAKDVDGMVRFAAENPVDFAVVTPDDPLVLGAVDALEKAGVPCFGPEARAAVIEGSKVFSKNLMKKYGIPTAAYEVFSDMDAALDYLETAPMPAVIKADGLALGKGVIICAEPCRGQSRRENHHGRQKIRRQRQPDSRGGIPRGPGGVRAGLYRRQDAVKPMVSSMDHKRALDGDRGLNTGGMGTVAPNPYYTPEIAAECMEKIFLPTIAAMNAEGRPFRGCLYFGLMLTADGPKVIEYNCRFGDPEAQVVLPLLEATFTPSCAPAGTAGSPKPKCGFPIKAPAASSWPAGATRKNTKRASK